MKKIIIKGEMELFPQKGGWYYMRIPKKYTKLFEPLADRGLVSVEATLGSSTWKTSLLPMGDGTQFIALKASIRKKEGLELGSKITLSFKPILQ